MDANPLSPRIVVRFALLLLTALPFLAIAEPPCDETDPDEPEREERVQVGVRREMHGDTCLYVYSVRNDSRDTLTKIYVGWDWRVDSCEITGASPHVSPDTAYAPAGYEGAPFQHEDPNTFSLGWTLADSMVGGVPPDTLVSGVTVALPRADSQYEKLNWMIRFRGPVPAFCYVGALKPERELEVPVSGTGTISGRVFDERGRSIPYPAIFLKKSKLETVSRSDGTYEIRDVPAGKVRLVARTVGYDPCEKGRVRVPPNGTARVDVRLAKWSGRRYTTGAPKTKSRPDSKGPAVACAPYRTAMDRVRLAFPGDLVDTVGARYLDRSVPVPSRSPWDTSERRPFIYSLTDREINLAYQGIRQDTLGTAFTVQIRREFQTAEEEHLLRIAEETYPPSEAVLAIAEHAPDEPPLQAQDRLWWYGGFDGVRLPYAVTMDAVRYYAGLMQAMGKGDSVQTGGFKMRRGKFSYRANISPRPSTVSRDGRVFRDVYVVDMHLEWSNYCGSLCACSFSLDRTVLLRRDGTVLCVFGDEKPTVVVS